MQYIMLNQTTNNITTVESKKHQQQRVTTQFHPKLPSQNSKTQVKVNLVIL